MKNLKIFLDGLSQGCYLHPQIKRRKKCHYPNRQYADQNFWLIKPRYQAEWVAYGYEAFSCKSDYSENGYVGEPADHCA